MTRTVFTADLHLRPREPAAELAALERFVDTVVLGPAPAARWVLLGDVFHFWMEWRGRVVGDFSRPLALFRRAADAGVAVHHVVGNRDFIVGADDRHPGFAGPAGGRSVLPDYGVRPEGRRFVFVQDGQRVLCLHGDDFCTRDYGFLALRWLLQGPIGRWGFRLAPLAGFAPFVRWELSRPRPPAPLDPPPAARPPRQPIQDDAWLAAARAADADLTVCGHLHRLVEKNAPFAPETNAEPDAAAPRMTRLAVIASWQQRWYAELANGHWTPAVAP